LDNDVDKIYDLAFAPILTAIRSNTWDGNQYAAINNLGDTGILISPDAIKANKINPVDIITTSGNLYNPNGDGINGPHISVSINNQVLGLIAEFGSISEAINELPGSQHKKFKSELTPERIKGSIHHELSHWLDDTFHNSHIKNRLNWANTASEKNRDYKKASNIMSQGKKAQDLSNYEINAQIHAIKQLKREHEDMWDLYDFNDIIDLNPSLGVLRDNFKEIGEYDNWKKHLLSRMYREKLLGDEMYRSI
jgi:hypothetical protein